MNALILIFFFLTTGSQAACLPDSFSFNKSFVVNADSRVMEDVAVDFEQRARELLPKGSKLILRLEQQNPRVNAEITKTEEEFTLTVWGGMLGHSKMNRETFLLLLCHELGHALGGPPLKARGGWSSTEGQADYFSGRNCFHALGGDESLFTESALALTSIYAEVTGEMAPDLLMCDPTEVARTNYGYPRTQCRLDTIIAGERNLPRPRCWFLP